MARRALMIALVLAAGAGAAAAEEPPSTPRGKLPRETSCFDCHSQLDGTALEPTRAIDADVHLQAGIGCHECHGGDPGAGFDGDPFAAHDEAKGFTGKPARLDIPRFCAKCHSDAATMKRFDPQMRIDQHSEYLTSVHGQRNSAGDEKAAVCVDCHGAHGILPPGDPRSSVHASSLADTCSRCHSDAELMRGYGLKANQVERYRTSVHAEALYQNGDLSAPTCNDCHGSHGAVPPGVDSVSNVCGSCHGREGSLFREVEARTGMDLAPCIRCVICHENHAVYRPTEEMLGVGPGSTCTGCHVEGEEGYRAADEMARSLKTLRTRLEEATRILEDAERAGVEVGPDHTELQKAQNHLVESRVLVHGFDLARFLEASEAGIAVADEGVAAGHRAFAELRFRRVGLAASLVVILGVIIALGLTIRRLEGGGPV